MKRLLPLLFLITLQIAGVACEACQIDSKQPEFLRKLTHGTNPQSSMDWFIVGFFCLVAVVSLVFSVKMLIRPGEKNSDHIKRAILNFENADH